MGRREKPVDPCAGPVQEFAYGLRELRSKAGNPTYRAMARRVEYSLTALSRAAAGQVLPTLPVALAYVRACGGDAEEWEERWHRAAEETTSQVRREDVANAPYRGLARFEPADEELFFGRDRLTDDLLRLVGAHRFVAVFGPSGSGKSSLLRAGLVPRLQQGEDPGGRPAAIRMLTPGSRPLDTHDRVFTPASADGETWLIVDQFEEVYTLCRCPDERAKFIESLLTALDRGSRLRVVLGVRADFYGRCAEHRGLTAAVQDASVLVGPMEPDELRDAVVKPAAAKGLTVERSLTARLIEETGNEPGGLPLFSHVLLETWQRRKGRMLTLDAYETVGGIQGAVADTAEDVYTRLSPDQAALARRILLRLVNPSEGARDTRRPVERAELDTDHPEDTEDTAHVLEHLARARLITLDGERVHLAHEALIWFWPRLRHWIEDDRQRLRLHRQLTDAARAWERLGRDSGSLYRGARLAAADVVFGTPRQQRDMTALERDFLAASRARRTRGRRRRSALTGAVAVLVVLTLVSALFAWQEKKNSNLQRDQATARRVAETSDGMRAALPQRAQLLSLAAYRVADLPQSRSSLIKASIQKEHDLLTDADREDGAQGFLTGNGRRMVRAGKEHVRVWDVPGHRRVSQGKGLGAAAGSAVDISPDGRRLALSSAGGLKLWDVAAGRPDGAPLTSADWGRGGAPRGEFGPSGRTLLTRSAARDGPASVQLWDLEHRRTLLERRLPDAEARDGAPVAAVSAGDRYLALCAPGAAPQVWDVSRKRELPLPRSLSAHRKGCKQLHFSPDGRQLALATDGDIRVWKVTGKKGDGERRIKVPGFREMEFSPDGDFLATFGAEQVQVWRTGNGDTPIYRYPILENQAAALRWSRDGRYLRYFDGPSRASVRSLTMEALVEPAWSPKPTRSAVFSPDARLLATVTEDAGDRHRLQLRDGRTGKLTATLGTVPEPAEADAGADAGDADASGADASDAMAFDPTGGTLAAAVGTGPPGSPPSEITLWDTGTHRKRGTLRLPDGERSGDDVSGIAFSPDGKRLLAVGQADGGSLTVWDLERRSVVKRISGRSAAGDDDARGFRIAVRPDGQLVATSRKQLVDLGSGRTTRRALVHGTIAALAFSPDGKRLAVADDGGQVTLWDGEGRQRLGELSGSFTSLDRSSPESVSSLAFSPDSKTLAVGGDEGTIHLWDVPSQQKRGGALLSPGDTIRSLMVSADGSTLHATARHVPLRRHPLTPEKVAERVCERVTTKLSRELWDSYLAEVDYRELCEEESGRSPWRP
ncbi:DNA-binding protein [Streptomyces boncukensis]|uniref:DNA-binding protein n=1 Tax=Streptomyces boncukensis TaxID=2711219 RepID=A0A6G4X2A3_9ACTN|nr:DNA-binding protein [Streptomyces boncukensis]NGO71010.1 DNA-binding protein [Streptomyces boncukensis]